MSWRWRKRIKIAPGLALNLSKSGLSMSAGVPGATVNVGRRGLRGTAGLPGTGLSVSKQIPWQHRSAAAQTSRVERARELRGSDDVVSAIDAAARAV